MRRLVAAFDGGIYSPAAPAAALPSATMPPPAAAIPAATAAALPSAAAAAAATTFTHAGSILIGRAAGAADFGTLTIEGNLAGAGGAIHLATVLNHGGDETLTDLLRITGDYTGSALLAITAAGGAGDNTGTGAADGIKVVSVDGGISGAFALAAPVTAGVFDYGLVRGDGGFYLQAVAPIPEIPAACALPGIAALAGQAGLDSVLQRVGDLRFTEEFGRGGWWLRDAYTGTRLKNGGFGATRFHANVFQFGCDRTFLGESASWSVGAFYAHTTVSGKIASASHVDGDADGFGVYGMTRRGRLYVSALLKCDDNDYRVRTDRGGFSVSGWNLGAVLETGWTLKAARLGTLEAQVMAGWQRARTGAGWDYGRGYAFDDGESLLARAGLRWHRRFELAGGEWLHPWLRAGASREFLNRGTVRVRDAGSPAHAGIYDFENDLRGGQFIVDGGLAFGLTPQFHFNMTAALSTGGVHESLTATAGFRYVW